MQSVYDNQLLGTWARIVVRKSEKYDVSSTYGIEQILTFGCNNH